MSAMAMAFHAKGVDRNEVEFQIAMAKYLNHGGTTARIRALCDAADEKGSGGPPARASGGFTAGADAPPTNDGEAGQWDIADKADLAVPAPPSPQAERGEGQFAVAEKAWRGLPSPSLRPMPGHARRGAIAIAAVQPTMAASLFDSIVLPDGRKLGAVRWNECPALAKRYSRLSRILIAVHNYSIPPDPNETINLTIPEGDLRKIVADVEAKNAI